MMSITWSRPASPGSRPLLMSPCRTSRHPYTAEDPPAWMSMTSRPGASWRARMRLTGLGLDMR